MAPFSLVDIMTLSNDIYKKEQKMTMGKELALGWVNIPEE